MKIITDVSDWQGKYVLVRSSANVPVSRGQVTNAYRLDQALPTLRFLRQAGARVIVLAHIGRDATDTLRPVFDVLQKKIPITWGGSMFSQEFATIREQMRDGDIVLVENLRQDEREAQADEVFARQIAAFGEVYVNDAFDNTHRDHASMIVLPTLLPAYAGLTLAHEVTEIEKVMTPETPSLFILGGAKFETKMPLLHKYIDHYDSVFVGGALANDIIAGLGFEIGQSLRSDVSLVGDALLHHPKLVLPIDVVAGTNTTKRVCHMSEVRPDEMIVDMGPETVARLAPYIKNAKTILWNGPLGRYEFGGDGSTHQVAKLVAAADGFSVLGGGDTIAAVEELGLNDKFGFVSTGGGAMLTLLEAGTTKSLSLLS
jgi:phosphoglycerate kinase